MALPFASKEVEEIGALLDSEPCTVLVREKAVGSRRVFSDPPKQFNDVIVAVIVLTRNM